MAEHLLDGAAFSHHLLALSAYGSGSVLALLPAGVVPDPDDYGGGGVARREPSLASLARIIRRLAEQRRPAAALIAEDADARLKDPTRTEVRGPRVLFRDAVLYTVPTEDAAEMGATIGTLQSLWVGNGALVSLRRRALSTPEPVVETSDILTIELIYARSFDGESHLLWLPIRNLPEARAALDQD
jgi:hypothetical protein